jgi:hypothetical protein
MIAPITVADPTSSENIADGELVNCVVFVPADDSLAESWSSPGDPAA